jgi:hypothetical protein
VVVVVRRLLFILALASCAKKPEAPAAAAPPPAPAAHCEPVALDVLHADKLNIDGKLDELEWHKTPNTGALSAVTPKEIVTHTEVRALYDDKALYLGWYAADEDIGKADVLTAELNGKTFETRPSSPHVDSDGTFDNPSDDDEEWTAELVVPWSELGLSAPPKELKADFRRDDQPKNSHLRHQRWAGPCGGVLRFK